MSQSLSQALVGEKVSMTLTVGGRRQKRRVTVGAYHSTEPSNTLGHWFCVTHDEHFENQFQKDTHINSGTHELAWMCHEHGIEQPTSCQSSTVTK